MRFALVSLFVLISACATADVYKLYVGGKDSRGNDAWSGTRAKATDDGTDGPLATIEAALAKLREYRQTNALPDEGVRIVIRGDHTLSAPLTFTTDDSGTEEAPIVIEGAGDTPATLSGGLRVGPERWLVEDGIWVADVPEMKERGIEPTSLWVNGARRTRARTPNAANDNGDYPPDSDFFQIDQKVMETDANGAEKESSTRFRYREGQLQNWPSLKHATLVVFHSWETSHLRLAELNETDRIVSFTGPTVWPFAQWQPDQRYFIENLREGLDVPGEWYFDIEASQVRYVPVEGETLESAEVYLPLLEKFLVLQGTGEEHGSVEHIHFKNLRFAHSHYQIKPEGHSDPQAAASTSAAIEATYARNCLWLDCTVQHTGAYAVWLKRGAQENRIERCELSDLGAGGVRIGESASPATPADAADKNVVENCLIQDGGRIFRAAVGVWIGRASHNTITHNDIGKFRYTGVSVGWLWGYDESTAHHNVIEYNHIHQIGMGQLNDMGGIYTLGVSPGTVLRGNVIHDVRSHPRLYGGWGLYTDEGSSEILLEKNIVYNTETGGFHQHYGRDNRVVNNVFAYSHGPQIIRTRQEPHNSFFFENNIVYYNNNKLLGSNWDQPNFTLGGNLYWNTAGAVDFIGKSLAEWQGLGHDKGSVIADPMFTDPENGDFSLAEDSPARKLGFPSLDCRQAGLYGDKWSERASPCLPPQTPLPTVPQPPAIADDFESTNVGAPASAAQLVGETDAATIRVTEETAAAGARSLKFTDAPNLDKQFNPHLIYTPGYNAGTVTASFALRVEPGALVNHEWRDSNTPYRVGPSINIGGDGSLTASGQQLLTLPQSAWCRFEIVCALGEADYRLAVTLPDGASHTFEKLPVGSANFNRLDWLGFVSNATDTAVFYLDDLQLEAK